MFCSFPNSSNCWEQCSQIQCFGPKREQQSTFSNKHCCLFSEYSMLMVFLKKTLCLLSESVIYVRLLQWAGFVWTMGEQLEVWPIWAPAFILISPRFFLSTLASLLLFEALKERAKCLLSFTCFEPKDFKWLWCCWKCIMIFLRKSRFIHQILVYNWCV